MISLLLGLSFYATGCDDQHATCSGKCPYIDPGPGPVPADGTLTFDYDGTQLVRQLPSFLETSATISAGLLTLEAHQGGESLVLTVLVAGQQYGVHEFKVGTGYTFAVGEESLELPAQVRGDYEPLDSSEAPYGTIDVTSIFLQPGGSIYGTLDATLPRASEPSAPTVHAQIQIHAPIAPGPSQD